MILIRQHEVITHSHTDRQRKSTYIACMCRHMFSLMRSKIKVHCLILRLTIIIDLKVFIIVKSFESL